MPFLELGLFGFLKPSEFQKPFLVYSLVFYIPFVHFNVKLLWTPFQVFQCYFPGWVINPGG